MDGMTPWLKTCTWRAPVKVNASIGAMSKCSIVSANRRPSTRSSEPRAPGRPKKCPSPTAVTSSNAQTRSGTALAKPITHRAT